MEASQALADFGRLDSITWIKKGQLLEQSGRLQQALLSYDRAIERDVDDEVAVRMRDSVSATLRRMEAEIAGLNLANGAARDDPKRCNDIGTALQVFGEYEAAILYYAMAIGRDASYKEAWFNRAVALIPLGRFIEAFQCLDEVLKIDPRDPDAHRKKGDLLYDLARSDDALVCYDNMLQANLVRNRAELAALHGSRARCLSLAGRASEALHACDLGLSADSSVADLWGTRGDICGVLGMHDGHVYSDVAALTLDPTSQGRWFDLGATLHDTLRQHEAAVVCFERALELGNRDAPARIAECEQARQQL
jgi:tetratricopeptide (TPR) repeat protein